MLKKLKSWLRAFFTLNKSEQRGIIILLVLIVLLLIFNQMLPLLIKHETVDEDDFFNDVETFRQGQQHIYDSIRIEKLQNRGELDFELASQKLKPFPFNPNRLPEEAWRALGLTKKQIKTIKNYEAKGGSFNRKEDLKKMYGISEVEYNILEPYIRIPSPFKSKSESQLEEMKEKRTSRKRKSPEFKRIEINSADSATLTTHLLLSPWLARRVIKYRNLLGGYYSKVQLREVYGLDSADIAKRLRYISIDTTGIHKLNINKSSFKELLRHPYMSYNITKYIVNTRKKNGDYKSIYQLIESDSLTEMWLRKTKPYLTVD